MKLTKTDISNFNLFFLFISIIWTPLQVYYLNIDGAGRTIVFLAIVAILLNIGQQQKNKSVLHSPGFICWTTLTIYSIINSIFKGHESELNGFLFFRYNFIEPFVFLWITLIELVYNKKRCLSWILIALLLYMLMGSTHFTLWDVDDTRIVADKLGNTLPMRAVTALFIASILFVEKKLKGNRWTYAIIIFFTFLIIIITSTRKAFGASIIILVGALLMRIRKLKLGSIVVLLFIAVILIKSIGFVMDNTYMGQRLSMESEEYEEYEKYDITLSSNPQINNFLTIFLGDRTFQYYEAINAHKKNPITGIGIGNFRSVTGFPYVLHSEYMVHYCENGIIGFSLLLLFYFLLFAGFRKKRKEEEEKLAVYLFGLLAVLFINFTSWTYNNPGVLIIYAIILTKIYSTEPSSFKQSDNKATTLSNYFNNPLLFIKFKDEEAAFKKKRESHHNVAKPGNLLTVKIEPLQEENVEVRRNRHHHVRRAERPGNLLTTKIEYQQENNTTGKPKFWRDKAHRDKREEGPGNLLTIKQEPHLE